MLSVKVTIDRTHKTFTGKVVYVSRDIEKEEPFENISKILTENCNVYMYPDPKGYVDFIIHGYEPPFPPYLVVEIIEYRAMRITT